jgi:hypothetical protein
MPLNSKKLGGVFIELRVIPQLFSDDIRIQKASVLWTYLIFYILYVDRIIKD